MKKRTIAIIAAVALAVAIVGGWLVAQATGGLTIKTATATTTRLDLSVTAPGTVEPTRTHAVFAPTSGTLATIHVTDGQEVTAGQQLATMDAAPLRTAVAQAEAQVAAARAMPTGSTRLTTARNTAITAANASLSQARAHLAAATLKAPVAGTVTFASLSLVPGATPLVTTQVGASVTPGWPVFTIAAPGDAQFVAHVDESDIGQVQAGQAVSLALDAYPGQQLTGTVGAIRPSAITTKTGGTAFHVTVALPDAQPRLLEGMTGDATIALASVDAALTVPAQAIVNSGGERSVFKVTGQTVTLVTVTLGQGTDTLAQVTDGLTAGDVVAIDNLSALTDGAKVRVQP